MRRCALFALSLLFTAVVLAGPPETKVEPVKEVLHGVELIDDYRWLEGSDAPEIEEPDPELDVRVGAWTDAQNAYTRSVLDRLPGREELEARLRELMEVGSVGAPEMRRNRYFYLKREGDQAQPILYMREGAKGTARVLVDPNSLDEEGLTTMAWFEPNHDGSLVAFGLYRAGDENATLYLLEVDTGTWLAEEIAGKVEAVNWLPDSSGFFYGRLADIDNPYSGQVKFHKLGTHHRQDAVLFEQYKEGPLSTTWGPFAYTSTDGRWMILGYWTGTDSNDLWVVDLDRWLRSGDFAPVTIIEGERATAVGPVVGDTLYMLTTHDAPNQRVVAVDLNDPSRKGWREIIPERRDEVLEDVSVARGVLVVEYLKNASSRIELFGLDGTPRGELALPGIGSAGVATAEDRTEAFLVYTSFNEPRSIYRVDLKTGKRELWERPEVPVDPSLVEVEQVWYPSKDGTQISMFLVHRKGLKRDGSHPTILTGYGGFNISRTPRFRATYYPWFEAGGVYALPNLRGGGEYGETWHRAGMLENKQNVFDDFIAAAGWLIKEGYTRPERLGISGGSNGGLLTGAALTQRPDLFSAVISAVPLLDMVRYHSFLMARYWVPEYGSSEDADQLQYLLAYSPYHKVKKQEEYPAVFLTAAENDTRVHALHARKMAALLQASTASDPEREPILLWVDRDAGHGPGKPLDLRVREVADQRIFLMWQLGVLDQAGGSSR